MSEDANPLGSFTWSSNKQEGESVVSKLPISPISEEEFVAPVSRQYGEGVTVVSEQAAPPTPDSRLNLDVLLKIMVDNKAPDLHLTANAKPMLRIKGDLVPIVNIPELSASQVQAMMYNILTPKQQSAFESDKELNLAYALPGKGRFRVNIYRQRGTVASAIRSIPDKILDLSSLGMPDVVGEFADLPRGLVLVTGPTGSGKSTTLAAIVDKINRTHKAHIITIEDPIEFVHQNKESIINQREVGVDTHTFNDALKNALRQDPDVILLGEMRDLETISTALTAAETGHLVFATLHTQSVSETMSRIIDVFPEGSKNQVRSQLAATIQAIVCQTLIKKLDDSGRVAAVEILKGTGNIRSLIRKGQDEQIRSTLETNKGIGMQTMDSHLYDLLSRDIISVEDGITNASSPDNMLQLIGGPEGYKKIKRRQEALGGHSGEML